MIREFKCSNINGFTIVVREESLSNIIVIYDVTKGYFVRIEMDKPGVNLKRLLEDYAHAPSGVDFSVSSEGEILSLSFDKSTRCTTITIEDRAGKYISINLAPAQFNTLLEFTRHAISNFNTSDNSFYLNVFTTR